MAWDLGNGIKLLPCFILRDTSGNGKNTAGKGTPE